MYTPNNMINLTGSTGTVTTASTSNGISSYLAVGQSGSTLQWNQGTGSGQWITNPQYTIPVSTPHGCNITLDGIKLVVMTVRSADDLLALFPSVNDLVFCLDTKEYWQCVNPSFPAAGIGLLNQIVTTDRDKAEWRKVIITDNLEVVPVVDPTPITELNEHEKEIYEAFEKILIENCKHYTEKKEKETRTGTGVHSQGHS